MLLLTVLPQIPSAWFSKIKSLTIHTLLYSSVCTELADLTLKAQPQVRWAVLTSSIQQARSIADEEKENDRITV